MNDRDARGLVDSYYPRIRALVSEFLPDVQVMPNGQFCEKSRLVSQAGKRMNRGYLMPPGLTHSAGRRRFSDSHVLPADVRFVGGPRSLYADGCLFSAFRTALLIDRSW